MDGFREPNFPLVARVLVWLVEKFDPRADLADDWNSEEDRVLFLKAVSRIVSDKAHLRLNAKRLYSADLYAVPELLKLAGWLRRAVNASVECEVCLVCH